LLDNHVNFISFNYASEYSFPSSLTLFPFFCDVLINILNQRSVPFFGFNAYSYELLIHVWCEWAQYCYIFDTCAWLSTMPLRCILCVIKHHTMTYWAVEVQLHASLTLALDGCEWSASCPSCFTILTAQSQFIFSINNQKDGIGETLQMLAWDHNRPLGLRCERLMMFV
jgi:hypothetical protein